MHTSRWRGLIAVLCVVPWLASACGGSSSASSTRIGLSCAVRSRTHHIAGTPYHGSTFSARLPAGWKVLNVTRDSLDIAAPQKQGLVGFVRVSHDLAEGGYTPDAFRDMVLSQSSLPFEDQALKAQGYDNAIVRRLRDLGTLSLDDSTQWRFQETWLRTRGQGAREQVRTLVAIHDEYQGTYTALLSLIAARQDRWSALKPQLEAVERTVVLSTVRPSRGAPADNPLTDSRSAFWVKAIPGRSLCPSS